MDAIQHTIYRTEPSKRCRQATAFDKCLSWTVVVLLLMSVTWSTYLYVKQTTLTKKISELDAVQRKLLASMFRDSPFGGVSDKDNEGVTRYTLERVRRQAEGGDRTTNGRRGRTEKAKKKKRIMGAHFAAEFDSDRMLREHSEGTSPSIGNMTRDGLVVKEQVYKIWTPMDWNNKKFFQYNPVSGKVKVRSPGLYLIYGQIMFHSPYVRRSFGIHVNDETMPYVEALSFRRSQYHQRVKRHLSYSVRDAADDDNSMFGLNITQDLTDGRIRNKRTIEASYSQCNTIAVAYLNKNDEVFLKSLEHFSIVIPKKYLTFWGLVKL